MEEQVFAKSSSVVEVSNFWKAIEILHEKPHCINRRLSGIKPIFWGKVHHPSNGRDILKIILEALASHDMEEKYILMFLKSSGIQVENMNSFASCDWTLCISVRKLLSRNTLHFFPSIELTILDKNVSEAIFVNLLSKDIKFSPISPIFPYSLSLITGNILLTGFGTEFLKEESSVMWLRDNLLPKIVKWTGTNNNVNTPQSLNLISVEQYSILYQELKVKYGEKLVKMWPEKTDPYKFVYEDIAIATYLLLLWEDQRKKRGQTEWRQSFVDLGCGNGLLVYILSSEGFPGIGIDVRKRGIWDYYPESTILKVESFVPSENSVFPQTDWIIGNHSDELTPWIPVITAWSSYKCSFFLLPCCPYDFDGSRYKRLDSSRSQYSEYLEYIQNVSTVCGFIPEIDKLRIPSTKRTCLVGMMRNYSEVDFHSFKQDVVKFLKSKVKIGEDSIQEKTTGQSPDNIDRNDDKSLHSFKPRNNKEVVRNCTQLNKSLINIIIDHVAKLILSNLCVITSSIEDGKIKSWNKGGTLKLSEVAASIPRSQLLELKRECGGLQTLLKNHHYIFSVVGGEVSLKVPEKKSVEQLVQERQKRRRLKEIKYKQKPCWFDSNHPDGCILKDEDCTFQHKSDIQASVESNTIFCS